MKEIYYVRRGVAGEILSTRMSTPDKIEALHSAADSAILNPGFVYAVYEGSEKGRKIGEFFVKE